MNFLGYKIERIKKDTLAASRAAKRLDTQEKLLIDIDNSIIKAASMVDSLGYDESEDPFNEYDYDDHYEMIYHCGTCTVRYVLEQIWPSIEAYIDFKSKI